MMNTASTSNPSSIVEVGQAYPYPSHFVAPNFVTLKLSGKDTYTVWETQILCLLKSHHMFGFIDGKFPNPAGNGKSKEDDIDAWIASDSVVKCWILGTLSDGVAKKVVNRLRPKDKKTDFSAKDLWDELQRSYGPVCKQAAETKMTTRQAESVIEVSSISEDAKSKDRLKITKEQRKRWIYDAILEGDTRFMIKNLEKVGLNPWDKLTNNGNTTLHVAVGSSTKDHELLQKLLEMTPTENTLLDLVNSAGSSLLHVAAIGGNIEVVDILVKRNPELLLAKDKEGHTSLALSVSNMHTKLSQCLFEHMKAHGYGSYFSGQSGVDLVVLAISCQDFRLASMIIDDSPDAILSDSDAVLTALAQNFPRELNFWESRDFRTDINRRTRRIRRADEYNNACWTVLSAMLLQFLVYILIGFHAIVTAAFLLFLKAIVHPFIKDTSQVYKDAENLLRTVCYRICYFKDSSSNYYEYYNSSIFEATRRNSSTFIRWIIGRFPDAIWSTNEDGHNSEFII